MSEENTTQQITTRTTDENGDEPPPSSLVEQVLADASADLRNSVLLLPAILARPIRDWLLVPALGLAAAVVPRVAAPIPFADSVAAYCLSVPFAVVRAGYGLLHGGSDGGDRRKVLAETRIGAFVAEEIRRNCSRAEAPDLQRQFEKEQDGSFTFEKATIISPDGTPLYAFVMEPVGREKKKKLRPAVVFVNSWTYTEHEYIAVAAKLAKRGYVVLSYCTRGFGKSGGLVNVAGPKDREDMGSVLDWLESNARDVDMDNVGIAGISYGAGLSLIGVATQDRIKAAASLAGWADLGASLYGSQSPRVVWGAFLLMSGYMAGDMDPVIKDHLAGILLRENVDEILEWAADRSAMTFVDQINEKSKPIYMSNSFGDDLFNANQAFRFFERLSGPKRMDCNQGIHGTPEFFGLLGDPNYVWENVYDFFDYHLKGADNSVMDTQLTMEVKLQSRREEFGRWPSPRTAPKRLYLRPRGFFSNGTLSDSRNTDDARTTISSLPIGPVAMSSGIPLLSSFCEAHLHQAIPAELGINRFRSIVYFSDRLESALEMRGHVRLNLVVGSSIGKAQIIGYLYDHLGGGVSKLITHGVVTKKELTPNEDTNVTIDFQATAYSVPRGHQLAIAISTRDRLYAPPTRSIYKLTVVHSPEQQSVLEMECID